MAPSDSMGFAAEIEGSSEGGTATLQMLEHKERRHYPAIFEI